MPGKPATGELRAPMGPEVRLAPGCPIPDCSRCRPTEDPGEFLEAVQELHRALAPAPRTALLALGFIAGEDIE
ncbi:hypothetical protein [Nocardiopsis tropica]|uniref:Uncharacterized protein n=1 Tax=Nocardiopsis tropica TaxID=109330 RepID=A0ABU7KZM4_9ACTN|nr:hypothetical protein [Nocardiopsis umidischolae]MEE2054760.1 hypothetical protein [Nocardiopsis umidischolae]